MNHDEPIFVDDPAILASIARLAELCACTEEEAIGIAVKAELELRAKAAAGVDKA